MHSKIFIGTRKICDNENNFSYTNVTSLPFDYSR